MSELDFTKPVGPAKPSVEAPAKPSIYDPAMATEFFSSVGKPEPVAKGATIFAENEKGNRLLLRRDKMYLLLDGEVSLTAKNKVIGKIGKGEIFGEMRRSARCPAAPPPWRKHRAGSSRSTTGSFRAHCGRSLSSRS